jgi:hypothetical protein
MRSANARSQEAPRSTQNPRQGEPRERLRPNAAGPRHRLFRRSQSAVGIATIGVCFRRGGGRVGLDLERRVGFPNDCPRPFQRGDRFRVRTDTEVRTSKLCVGKDPCECVPGLLPDLYSLSRVFERDLRVT